MPSPICPTCGAPSVLTEYHGAFRRLLRDRHMSDPERLNGAADGEARTTLDIGMPTSTVNI